MYQPKKTKYKKYHKGKINQKTNSLVTLNFGDFGLKALESGRITGKQLESVRVNIKRKLRKYDQIWINVFPDTPLTSKPLEVRMGKGKGNVDYWVSKISPGNILFEVTALNKKLVLECLKSAANKLPLKTCIVQR
jgi:large subunit ribosomal protein L16